MTAAQEYPHRSESSESKINSSGTSKAAVDAPVGPQSRVIELSKRFRSLVDNGEFEQATVLHREIIAILENSFGKSNWRASSEKAFLKEIESIPQSGSDYQSYLTARGLLREVIGQIAAEKYAQAEQILRESIKTFEKVPGENSVSMACATEYFGAINLAKNNPQDARVWFLRAATIRKSLVGDDHPEYSNAIGMAAMACIDSKEYEEGEKLIRNALYVDRITFGNESLRYAEGLRNLARILIERDKLPEAEATTLQALQIIDRSVGSESYQAAYCFASLADINICYGNTEAASMYLQRSLAIYERSFPPEGLAITVPLERHAHLLRKLKNVDAAVTIEDRVAAIRSRLNVK